MLEVQPYPAKKELPRSGTRGLMGRKEVELWGQECRDTAVCWQWDASTVLVHGVGI